MPGGRTYKRRRSFKRTPRLRKRSYKRPRRYRRYGSRRRRQTSMAIPRGMPAQRSVTLRYVDFLSFPADSTGSPTYLTYRANSIFDPFAGVGGHQPLYHDQWAVFWKYYTVIGSKIRITCQAAANQATMGLLGVILSHDATMSGFTPETLMEQGRNRWTWYQPNTNGFKPRVLTQGYSAKKFWNVTNVKDNMSVLGAYFGSDPISIANWHIWNCANPQGGTAAGCDLVVTITYKCILSEAQVVASS